jgi:hypothetical protein
MNLLLALLPLSGALVLLALFWPDKPKNRRKANTKRQVKKVYSGMNELDFSYKLVRLLIVSFFVIILFDKFLT